MISEISNSLHSIVHARQMDNEENIDFLYKLQIDMDWLALKIELTGLHHCNIWLQSIAILQYNALIFKILIRSYWLSII